VTLQSDPYLGLLFTVEEYKVYGYITNTKIKFVVVLQDCSQEVNMKQVRKLVNGLCSSIRWRKNAGTHPAPGSCALLGVHCMHSFRSREWLIVTLWLFLWCACL
jgi:hypothetical protein